jgi:hypothetical protein
MVGYGDPKPKHNAMDGRKNGFPKSGRKMGGSRGGFTRG